MAGNRVDREKVLWYNVERETKKRILMARASAPTCPEERR
jgi:hypothetical protein